MMFLGTLSRAFFSSFRTRLPVVEASLVVCLLLVSTNCNHDGYPADNTWHFQGKAPSNPPGPSSFAYRYPDMAPVLDAAGLQDFVSKYRHHVVLLDFWASWSRQNREEMEMLVRLQSDLKDQGFQVIACNLDSPEDWGRTTVPILHSAGGNFPCVVFDKQARAELRAWLEPEWSYDVPARFVLSRSGRVVLRAFADTPISALEQQVRDLVRGGKMRDDNRLAAGEMALRLKLIHVPSGAGQSLGEITARSDDPARLAEQAANLVDRRLDRSVNPRLAIVPFSSLSGRAKAGPLGDDLSHRISNNLRDKGFFDQVAPARTQAMLDGAGQTVMAIEYDPSAVQGRIAADYLLIGWLRGDVGVADATASLAADTRE